MSQWQTRRMGVAIIHSQKIGHYIAVLLLAFVGVLAAMILLKPADVGAVPTCFDDAAMRLAARSASSSFPRGNMARNTSGCGVVPNGNQFVMLSSYYHNGSGAPGSTLHTPNASLRVIRNGAATAAVALTIYVEGRCQFASTSDTILLVNGVNVGNLSTTTSTSVTYNLPAGNFTANDAYGEGMYVFNQPIVVSASIGTGLSCRMKASVGGTGNYVVAREDAAPTGAHSEADQRFNQNNAGLGNGDKRLLGPGSAATNGAIALYTTLPGSDVIEYSIPTRLRCDITTAQTVRIRYYDTDSPNGGNASGTTQPAGAMRVAVYDESTGNILPGNDRTLNGALDGNDLYNEFSITMQPDRIYSIVWYNVNARNGVQVWMPYSEMTTRAGVDCADPVDPDRQPAISASADCNNRRIVINTADFDHSGPSNYTIQRRYRVRNADGTWPAWTTATWNNITHSAHPDGVDSHRVYQLNVNYDIEFYQFQFRTRGTWPAGNPTPAWRNSTVMNYGPCVRASCSVTPTVAGAIFVNEERSFQFTIRNTGANNGRTWAPGDNFRLVRGATGNTLEVAHNTTTAPSTNWTFTRNATPTEVGTGTTAWRFRYGGTDLANCALNVRYRPPCPSASCPGVPSGPTVRCEITLPSIIEAGTSGTVTVTAWYTGPSNAAPSGRITIANLSHDTQSARGPTAPAVPTTVNRGNSITYTYDNFPFGGAGVRDWDASLRILTGIYEADGTGGWYTRNFSCDAQSAVGNLPYLKEFGGDVWSGGNFAPSTCQPAANQGGIYAFNRNTGSARWAGASSEYTVTALLRINDFHSVSGHNPATTGLNSYPPKGLTFANYGTGASADAASANSQFGGGYGNDNGECVVDYYNDTRDPTLTQPGTTFPPTTSGTADPRDTTRTRNVPSTNPAGIVVPVRVGSTYRIRATGEFYYGGFATARADAFCVGDMNIYATPPATTWSNVRHAPDPSDDRREPELRINNAATNWNPIGATYGSTNCSRSHTYQRTITATTGSIRLSIYEYDLGFYGDNGGSLSVTITPIPVPPLPTVSTNPPAGRSQYQIPGDLTLDATTIPVGSQVAVYVDGDVYIRGNIEFGTGSYTSIEDLPNLAIIARGNIYVDSAVTRIDGLYVAQPLAGGGRGIIYTCAYRTGTTGHGFGTSAADNRDIYASCQNQLVVNGSLVARRIKFQRVYESLRNATFGETPDFQTGAGTNGAEVINYTPQMWLAPSPLRDPSYPEGEGGTSADPYDDIRALPPILR